MSRSNSSLNGDVYVGQLTADLEHGSGKKTFLGHPSIMLYEGDWKEGFMEGRGKMFL